MGKERRKRRKRRKRREEGRINIKEMWVVQNTYIVLWSSSNSELGLGIR